MKNFETSTNKNFYFLNDKKIYFTILFVLFIVFANLNILSAENIDSNQGDSFVQISFTIDWFKYSRDIAAIIEKYNIQNLLKRELDNRFIEKKKYSISPTGRFKISGTITDYKIIDLQKNTKNEITEKQIKIFIDYEIIHSSSGKIIFRKNNNFYDYSYYTEAYSIQTGKTDKDAFDEFLIDISEKFYKNVDIEIEKIKDEFIALVTPPKKIELSPVQKDIIADLIPEKKAFEEFGVNLDISIDDAYNITFGSGEQEYNQLGVNGNFSVNSKIYEGALAGAVSGHWTDYEEKAYVLDKVLFEYKKEHYTLSAGNIAPSFSNVGFNNSQEGVEFEHLSNSNKLTISFLAGREKRPHDYTNFARYNLGFNFVYKFNAKNQFGIYNVWTVDDKNSILYDTALLTPINVVISGIKGNFTIIKMLTLDMELVKSSNNAIKYIEQNDYYLSSKINYKKNKVTSSLNFERVAPEFFTPNGQAAVDKEKIGWSFSNEPFESLSFSNGLRYQFNNLKKQKDKTDYTLEGNIDVQYSPFSKSSNNNLKSLSISNNASYRKNYSKLVVGGEKDKHVNDFLYSFNLSNIFFNNFYNVNLSSEYENEVDAVAVATTINEWTHKLINGITYRKSIIKPLAANISLNHCYKITGDETEKTINGSAALSFKQTIKTLNLLADYMLSLNGSSKQGQDSLNHKFSLALDIAQFDKNIPFTLNLKADYEINRFEMSDNNCERFSISTSLKYNFGF